MSTNNTSDFAFPVRVYYEDTDAGGVVFYANYLKFFERARTEWLRRLGFNQSLLAQTEGIIFVVVGTQVNYKSPARLDDLLTIQTKIKKIGNASIDFEQYCERDGKILVNSNIQICCINLDTFKASPIPDSIRSILISAQDI
ncbi:4-hydroxybenzoyl-CoA thioesterase [Pelistega indica]|uniref:4-hydroxybenzoyl-CoA thioesterase n=1 Tax=Pelistega indica TaxID=1414851 RepID=V8G8V7_9BURK|nr:MULTISPECIES: tol-pal system-associated acyl-CoA thioesterase [Pelistega]ETD72398.1 4-hydroxybenzoyl-CoA thioesterase [Pelistega indica]